MVIRYEDHAVRGVAQIKDQIQETIALVKTLPNLIRQTEEALSHVAGGGINFAQRVMDCGDAGHILG